MDEAKGREQKPRLHLNSSFRAILLDCYPLFEKKKRVIVNRLHICCIRMIVCLHFRVYLCVFFSTLCPERS